jgi:hypothetical protein
MKRQTQVACAIIVIITFGAASFASPFWAMRQLRAAAAAGDPAALEKYVDFPALRESVKTELQATVIAPMVANSKLKDSPIAGLGAMMATAMLGPVVDSMVSPAGIAKMVQGHPEAMGAAPPDASEPASPATQSATPAAAPTTSAPDSSSQAERKAVVHPVSHYDGLSHFVVTYDVDGSTAKSAQLILRRDGPFSWKLAGVKLPPLH